MNSQADDELSSIESMVASEDVLDEEPVVGRLEAEVLKYSCVGRCFDDFCLCPFSFEKTDFDLENRLRNGIVEGMLYMR